MPDPRLVMLQEENKALQREIQAALNLFAESKDDPYTRDYAKERLNHLNEINNKHLEVAYYLINDRNIE